MGKVLLQQESQEKDNDEEVPEPERELLRASARTLLSPSARALLTGQAPVRAHHHQQRKQQR